MYQLVAPLGRWGRRLERPEHCYGQDGRHDHGEGDVEIFAHSQRLSVRRAGRKLTY
ncbi:hypothetical protein N9381_11455 [Paracoccaceae bacterium]|nr:hypothetical protein [Paracoccaceae bacterium]